MAPGSLAVSGFSECPPASSGRLPARPPPGGQPPHSRALSSSSRRRLPPPPPPTAAGRHYWVAGASSGPPGTTKKKPAPEAAGPSTNISTKPVQNDALTHAVAATVYGAIAVAVAILCHGAWSLSANKWLLNVFKDWDSVCLDSLPSFASTLFFGFNLCLTDAALAGLSIFVAATVFKLFLFKSIFQRLSTPRPGNCDDGKGQGASSRSRANGFADVQAESPTCRFFFFLFLAILFHAAVLTPLHSGARAATDITTFSDVFVGWLEHIQTVITGTAQADELEPNALKPLQLLPTDWAKQYIGMNFSPLQITKH
eukprot:GHVT01099709.1.p1 GENE.GHVT01099709.1~~GHVT01099709.1.p1  ORF type:complete len:313 (+),score=55.72 GHVT01099709.1:888-1826(+)